MSEDLVATAIDLAGALTAALNGTDSAVTDEKMCDALRFSPAWEEHVRKTTDGDVAMELLSAVLAANDTFVAARERYTATTGREYPESYDPSANATDTATDVDGGFGEGGFADADALRQLVGMGFAMDRARDALAHAGNDVNTALEILTSANTG